MAISPAAATENAIPNPLGVIARLSLAAAALSLTIAAALALGALLILSTAGLTASAAGPATALGLAAAGIVSGFVFRRVQQN